MKDREISDKYHETLDLYQKLSKNYSELETELEQKKSRLVHSKNKWQQRLEASGLTTRKENVWIMLKQVCPQT